MSFSKSELQVTLPDVASLNIPSPAPMFSFLNRFFYARNDFLFRAFRYFLIRIRRPLFKLNLKIRKALKLGFSAETRLLEEKVVISTADLKGFSLWLEGSTQFEKIETLAAYSNAHGPGQVYLDIGGNYGEFISVLRLNRNFARAFFFEPNPNVFPYLAENLTRFSRAGTGAPVEITPVHGAVVEPGAPPKVKLRFDTAYSGGGSLLTDYSAGNVDSAEVFSYGVDTIIRDSKAGRRAKELFVIKIDIEGYELNIILPLIAALKAASADYVILFETHYDASRSNCREVLAKVFAEANFTKFVYPKVRDDFDAGAPELKSGQYDLIVSSLRP